MGYLAGLDIQVATYARRNDSTLSLELLQARTGRSILRTDLKTAGLIDFGFYQWRFHPQKVGLGEELALKLSSPDADAESCLAVLVSYPDPPAETPVSLVVNGRRLEGSLPIRITGARPVPLNTTYLVWLIGIGLLAAAWLGAEIMGLVFPGKRG